MTFLIFFKKFLKLMTNILRDNFEILVLRFFFVNFDFKNGCKNENQDNNEKSYS